MASMRLSRWVMCYMTHLGQHVTLTWRQILTLTFEGHHVYCIMYMVRRVLTRQTRWYQNHLSIFIVSKFTSWKSFSKNKIDYFNHDDIYSINHWPFLKFDWQTVPGLLKGTAALCRLVLSLKISEILTIMLGNTLIFGKFDIFYLWWPQFWPEPKMIEGIWKLFLPSFRKTFLVFLYLA